MKSGNDIIVSTTPKIELFLDSSALVSGIISTEGAAHILLRLAESGNIQIIISEQVVIETERAITRKVPRALPTYRQALRNTGLRILRDPSPDVVLRHRNIIKDPKDVSIVVAAIVAKADFLVTLDRRHFIDDKEVSRISGLRIGTPGDALTWLRNNLQ